MRDVARLLREALPDVLRTLSIAGLVQLFAAMTGIAPAPAAYQIALTLLLAALIAAATVWQRHVAPLVDTHAGAGGRHAAGGLAALPLRDLAEATTALVRRRGPAEDIDQRWTRHVQDVTERWQGALIGPEPDAVEAEPERDAARDPLVPPPPPAPARPAPPGASRLRIAAVAAAAAALAALLWLPIGPVGEVAVAVTTFVVGYGAYALPALPLLALRILPPSRHEPVPWRRLLRRAPLPAARGDQAADGAARRRGRVRLARPTGADLGRVATAVLAATREHVFSRPAGVLLAALGLLHLVRDAPGFGDLAFRRAGGLAGLLVAEPLRWLASSSGGLGLLAALGISAAVVTAGYLRPYRGREFATACLAVLVLLPLLGLTVSRFFWYDYTLGARGDQVVVLAGVSPHARHVVEETGISTSDLSPSMGPLLATTGIPVTGRADGVRLARELRQPVAEQGFPATGGELRVGDCFTVAGGDLAGNDSGGGAPAGGDSAGGEQPLRYAAFCGAAHVGEVYFVGRLPLIHDPGPEIVDTVARAVCEKPYGAYLGVPLGGSYVQVEEAMFAERDAAWAPLPLVACWLRSVGPLPLRGAKLVASLAQGASWDTGPGCRTSPADNLTLTTDDKLARCVTPGRGRPESLRSGTLAIDASLVVKAGFPGDARVGAACVDGTDASSGYYVAVTANGSVELHKQSGTERKQIASAKPKGGTVATIRPGTTFAVVVKCALRDDGTVTISGTVGAVTVKATDKSAPVRRISPRLFVESRNSAPVTVAVASFSATLG